MDFQFFQIEMECNKLIARLPIENCCSSYPSRQDLQQEFEELATVDATCVVLDLTKVMYTHGDFLSLLVHLKSKLTARGIGLQLHVSKYLEEVFHSTRFERVFDIRQGSIE